MIIQTKTANAHKGVVLHSLQAARGIAAILVVLFHNSTAIFALPKYWGADPFQHLFDFGDSGVEFFFVLSGFIILYVHWTDIGKPERVFRYLKKRILRIYPLYWMVLPPIAVIYTFWFPSSLDFRIDFANFLSSALLIHFASGNTILVVAWTLFHEVLFYGVFAMLILNKRMGAAVLSLWLLVAFAFIASAEPHDFHEYALSPVRFFFSPLHLLFAMGMASAWLVRHSKVPAPVWMTSLGIIVFLGLAIEEDYVKQLAGDVRSLFYGIACSCIVLGAVTMELRGRLKVSPIAELLGNASYSIYLVHFPLLSVMAKIFFITKNQVPPILAYIVMVAAAICVGVAMHLSIEKPMLKYLGRYAVGTKP